MSRLRMSLLGLVAVCLVSMFMAAVASAEGPFWNFDGGKFKQGSVGIKLQNKETLSFSGTVSGLAVTITCGRSTAEGTIDGQGITKQGQGKGIFKYEQCKVETSGGPCVEPTKLTTNQLKAYLASGLPQGVEHIVEVFEAAPSQQTTSFVEILFGKCVPTILNGVRAPVKGNVAAVVNPQGFESQEGSLFFPPESISVVKHEGEERTLGLTLAGREAKFTGFYGVRVQAGRFGVFNS